MTIASRNPFYIWKVVYDPTRTGDYPGDFYGRIFRPNDIKPSVIDGDLYSFPNGTVFLNIISGKMLLADGNQLKKVTAQVCGTGAVERINNHA